MPVAPFGLIGDDPANTDPAVAQISALLSRHKNADAGRIPSGLTQVMLRLNLWDQQREIF